MGYEIEWAAACESLRKMHKRASACCRRDYGFAFTRTARMLATWSSSCATRAMSPWRRCFPLPARCAHDEGERTRQIKEGFLADILLVDGDPLSNLAILPRAEPHSGGDEDGVFYKQPEIRAARSRYGLSAA